MTMVHQTSPSLTVASDYRLPCAVWISDLQRIIEDRFSRSGRVFPWRQFSNSYRVRIAGSLLSRRHETGPCLDPKEGYSDPREKADAGVAWDRVENTPLGSVGCAVLLVVAAKAIAGWHRVEVNRELSDIESPFGPGKRYSRAVLYVVQRDTVPIIDACSGRLLRNLLGFCSTGPTFSHLKQVGRKGTLILGVKSRIPTVDRLDIAVAWDYLRLPHYLRCLLNSLITQLNTQSLGRKTTTFAPRVPTNGEGSRSDGRTIPNPVASVRMPIRASVGKGGES